MVWSRVHRNVNTHTHGPHSIRIDVQCQLEFYLNAAFLPDPFCVNAIMVANVCERHHSDPARGFVWPSRAEVQANAHHLSAYWRGFMLLQKNMNTKSCSLSKFQNQEQASIIKSVHSTRRGPSHQNIIHCHSRTSSLENNNKTFLASTSKTWLLDDMNTQAQRMSKMNGTVHWLDCERTRECWNSIFQVFSSLAPINSTAVHDLEIFLFRCCLQADQNCSSNQGQFQKVVLCCSIRLALSSSSSPNNSRSSLSTWFWKFSPFNSGILFCFFRQFFCGFFFVLFETFCNKNFLGFFDFVDT